MSIFRNRYRIRETPKDIFGSYFIAEFRFWWFPIWFRCDWRQRSMGEAQEIVKRHREGWVVWSDNQDKHGGGK